MRRFWPVLLFVLVVLSLASAGCGEYPDPPSAIESFTAEKTKVTKHHPDKLTAVFVGTGTIDHDIGPVESGVPIDIPMVEATTVYTLTVVDDSGETYTKSVEVDAIDEAVVTSFKADKVVRPGESTSITAVFSGGTGVIDNGIGPVQSGESKPTGVLQQTKIYTLTVTNEAGDSVTAMAEAEAAITPVIMQFSAPGEVVSRFQPTDLTAVFIGGHGVIDNGVGMVTSGAPIKSGKVPGKGATWTLTVTNGFGESVSKTVSVTTKKEILVADYGGDILIFDADAKGNVAPKRGILTGDNKDRGIDGILGVWVDDDEVFFAHEKTEDSTKGGGTSICVYDLGDDGDKDPKRRIAGPNTTLFAAFMFSIANKEIFLADRTDAVKVWNTSDNGNIAPKRVLAGPLTELAQAFATVVDGTELYVTNHADGSDQGSVTVYPVTASGNTPPTRKFSVGSPTGVVIAGSEMFVSTETGEIKVFDKTAGGSAPLRTIAGDKTQMSKLYQCAVNAGEIACSSYGENKVVVFPSAGNGNIAPIRVLEGEATYFNANTGTFIY